MKRKKEFKLWFTLVILSFILCTTGAWCQHTSASDSGAHFTRPVTIADSIRMTTIDNPNYSLGTWGRDDVAAFSPDGKRFVVIVKKGNVEQNTVEYSLLLYQTAQALSSSPPEVLASLSSSSPRPAIESVTWQDDRTLAFLGENPGERHQLYRVDCDSKRIRKLTNQPTDLMNYAFSSKGDIFFTAAKPAQLIGGKGNHVIVDRENLYQLVSGVQFGVLAGLDLFVTRKGSNRPAPLRVNGMMEGDSPPWPSPDGRYLAIQTIASRSDIPLDWYDYQTVAQQTILSRQGSSKVNEYELIDLATGASQPLIDAPVGAWYSNAAWSDDSRSVFISGTDLPLDVPDPAERKLRQANLFVAEVEIPSRRIVTIMHEDAIIRHWYSQTNELLLQLTNHQSFSNFAEGALVSFRRTREGWKQQDTPAIEAKTKDRIEIAVEEDMNTPPRLVTRDLKTGTRSLLLDPNPQFRNLQFGRVEEIKFKVADGHEMTAGLYRPPDYLRGKRYPLVIQTHGWTSDRFWIDGPDRTAMAAQSLAGKGFFVAQVGDDFDSAIFTPNEGKVAMAEFEGIIDYLNAMGLIDPNRVGIVAFSATGPGVGYAIAHSKYRFGAAVLSSTNDAGYFTYLSMFNLDGAMPRFEPINGGAPFGPGLASWLKEAPEFSLDKVSTAMRLEPNSGFDVFALWEWFVGFRRLGKPVEMVFMPDADHVVTRPQDRIISQGGAVDWFDFWLEGEEDPAPAKAQQYARWRELRKLQDAQAGGQKAN
jgi:dipeptidyl aminopeptidase/acylaminoacyl peptidase